MNPILVTLLKALVNELPSIIEWLLTHYKDETCEALKKHGFKEDK